MAHTGTMEAGGSAQTKQSGSPWLVIALTVAVVVAMIGVVWFASQRSVTLSSPSGNAVTLSSDGYLNSILNGAHAAPYAVTLSSDDSLDGILDRAHAAPYAGDATRLPLPMTSGTFQRGR